MTSIQRQLAVGASHLLLQRKRHPPAGSRPGTLAPSPDSPPPVVRLIRYDADHPEERTIDDIGELPGILQKGDGVTWIDVQGFGDEAMLHEVMKDLTIMASIFIPLTFLTGVYGMNFDYMPVPHIRWAYPTLLVVMFLIGASMVWFFRLKGWLGRGG